MGSTAGLRGRRPGARLDLKMPFPHPPLDDGGGTYDGQPGEHQRQACAEEPAGKAELGGKQIDALEDAVRGYDVDAEHAEQLRGAYAL